MTRLPAAALVAAILVGCGTDESPPPPESAAAPTPRFHDMTDAVGLVFRHTDGHSGEFYLMESVTAGLALFDADGDGDDDLYALNGAPLPGADPAPVSNVLYRNDGGWTFTDVTAESGLGDTGYGLGVTIGDVDNDGDPDVYVNNFGPNALYRNEGGGRFVDVTDAAGLSDGDHFGAGASFLDIEGDGDLDLYVARYVDFGFDRHGFVVSDGVRQYVGPTAYPFVPDALYRNEGNGRFVDVSEPAGIAAHAGPGMGMICLDYDDDGDTDVFVANDDGAGNYLFQNDGSGTFEEVGLLAGVAYDFHGGDMGAMGVDAGDADGDGRLDLYVTTYQRQWATFYRNLGDGFFEDASPSSGAAAGTFDCLTWGTGFVDVDNDADLDLFVAAGHIQVHIEQTTDRLTYECPNVLLLNDGTGHFTDVTANAGDGLAVVRSSRGAAFGDLDADGDLDAVVLNSRKELTLLRNDTATDHHWIEITLEGVSANRDGVGSRVSVTAGGRTQVAEVHSGRSYQGHHGTRLHFGLGSRDTVAAVTVRWLGGGTDRLENVPANRRIRIRQGSTSP